MRRSFCGDRRKQLLRVEHGADLAHEREQIGEQLTRQGRPCDDAGRPRHPAMRSTPARAAPCGRCTLAAAMSEPALKLPLEIEDIKAILPHRAPFLLLDRILELEPDRRVVGLKNVTSNERYFIAGPGGLSPRCRPRS